jgi:hypothetical protein
MKTLRNCFSAAPGAAALAACAAALAACAAAPPTRQQPVDQEFGAEPGFRSVSVRVGYSPGTVRHQIRGTGVDFDDETDAHLVRLRVEGGAPLGGGVTAEWYQSDDDLFATTPGNPFGPAELTSFNIAPHVRYRFGENSRLRAQVRLGFPFEYVEQDFQNAPIDPEWIAAGGRLAVEPELLLLTEPGLRWSVHAEAAASLGYTLVLVETSSSFGGTTQEDFSAFTTGYGLEAGTRLELGHFDIGVSYMYRHTEVDEGRVILGIPFGDFESEFEGFMFVGGVRF